MRVEKLRVAVASCELQLRVASSVFRRFQTFPAKLILYRVLFYLVGLKLSDGSPDLPAQGEEDYNTYSFIRRLRKIMFLSVCSEK